MTRAGRTTTVTGVGACVIALLFATTAHALPGDLDTSFSGDGIQTTDLGGVDEAADVALQADGRFIVAGTSGNDFAIARYDVDGSLDASFSGDGVQTTGFGGIDRAHGVVVQTDGRVVVIGDSSTSEHAQVLARYDTDGSLDSSFSEDGLVTTSFSEAGGGGGDAVALQPDGKIVAVGAAGDMFTLVRYNIDGSVDASFSDDGRQTTDFDGVTAQPQDVVIQSDGRIVVVGFNRGPGVGPLDTGDFAIARYNDDGSPDPTFSADGRQTTDFGGGEDATSVAVQGDGKLVVAGRASSPSGVVFALARYSPDGSLDTGFSGDGRETTDFDTQIVGPGVGTGEDIAEQVAIQEDGKIVIGGRADTASLSGRDAHFALARHNADGSLDPTFATGGKRIIDFDGFEDENALGMALQTDGRILLAGWAVAASYDFALARVDGGSPAPQPGPPSPLSPPVTPPPSPPVTTMPPPDAPSSSRPNMTGFALSPSTFRVSNSATAVAASMGRVRRGSQIRFSLTRRATVVFRISRKTTGRRVGGMCQKRTSANRNRKRCTRYFPAGMLRRTNRPAGANRVSFSGRLGRRALPIGSYRLFARPTSASGERGSERSTAFKIIR